MSKKFIFLIVLMSLTIIDAVTVKKPNNKAKTTQQLKQKLKLKQAKLKKALDVKINKKQKKPVDVKINAVKTTPAIINVTKPQPADVNLVLAKTDPKIEPKTEPKATTEKPKPTEPKKDEPKSTTVNVTVDEKSDNDNAKKIEEWLGIAVASVAAIKIAFPIVNSAYSYVKGQITFDEFTAIIRSDNISKALTKKLKEKGFDKEAESFENLDKYIDKSKTVLDGVKELRKDGLEFSTKDLGKVKDLIQKVQQEPAKLAKEIGEPVEKVDALKETITEHVTPKLDAIAEKISSIDVAKLTPEETIQFNELNSQFESLLKSIEPIDLSLNSLITPQIANTEFNSIETELQALKPAEVLPTETLALPEMFVG